MKQFIITANWAAFQSPNNFIGQHKFWCWADKFDTIESAIEKGAALKNITGEKRKNYFVMEYPSCLIVAKVSNDVVTLCNLKQLLPISAY